MTGDLLLQALHEGLAGQALPYRLGVAVSGGSDSLALLHLLADSGKFDLSVVTVNHGLRQNAASEALHVGHICEGLGVPQVILDWTGWDGRGNLQDQARRNRYSLIADWARAEGLDAVALGHTEDDLAETLLMRLARRAGVDGLSAMPARFRRDGVAFLRPLLSARRVELRSYLAARNVTWVDDPSNDDTLFERARAREVLAALSPLGIEAETLAAVARNLSEARTALGTVAAEWVERSAKVDAGDVILDRTALAALPAELCRRVVGGALRFVASAEYPPRGDAMDGLLDAIAERRNHTLSGCYVMSTDMTVRITREAAAVAGTVCATDRIWDGRWHIDGPHLPDLRIQALGETLNDVPHWREARRPRASLLASPAVWRGDTLIAAPLAGFGNGWTAQTPGRDALAASLVVT